MSRPTTPELRSTSPQASLVSQYDHESTVVASESEAVREKYERERNLVLRSITEDLGARMVDWKGYPLTGLGQLQLYDYLRVNSDGLWREMHVYLFQAAFIFAADKKDTESWIKTHLPEGSRGAFELEGRIFIRHVQSVTVTEENGEFSLSFDVKDGVLDNCKLLFRDPQMHGAWKSKVLHLIPTVTVIGHAV